MITYPVDVENARFTVIYSGETRRRQRWSRGDGQVLTNIQPGFVILEESVAAVPAYDPLTEKLSPGAWVDDEPNESAVFTVSVVALDAGELAAVADEQDRAGKRVNVANAVSTLRDWATQAAGVTVTSGNAVATLQTMVDRMGTFFDRFADLIEGQRWD